MAPNPDGWNEGDAVEIEADTPQFGQGKEGTIISFIGKASQSTQRIAAVKLEDGTIESFNLDDLKRID